MNNDIIKQTTDVMHELLEAVSLRRGDIFVVGCSTSEITGGVIGHASSEKAAIDVFNVIYKALSEKGIYLAAQCCEHLNRALIIERECAEKYGYDEVCVKPRPHAGGWFATTAYAGMKDPVAVEHIRANAGLDIGGTLIGMHLRDVAVPVRLTIDKIGCANILCARTRPKYIGGSRAEY